MRQAFWERFGLHLEDLGSWPSAQIEDYIEIMAAEAHVNNERNGASSGSTPQSQNTTEAAYRAMSAQAVQRG